MDGVMVEFWMKSWWAELGSASSFLEAFDNDDDDDDDDDDDTGDETSLSDFEVAMPPLGLSALAE
jgi:hypothetical protein